MRIIKGKICLFSRIGNLPISLSFITFYLINPVFVSLLRSLFTSSLKEDAIQLCAWKLIFVLYYFWIVWNGQSIFSSIIGFWVYLPNPSFLSFSVMPQCWRKAHRRVCRVFWAVSYSLFLFKKIAKFKVAFILRFDLPLYSSNN